MTAIIQPDSFDRGKATFGREICDEILCHRMECPYRWGNRVLEINYWANNTSGWSTIDLKPKMSRKSERCPGFLTPKEAAP